MRSKRNLHWIHTQDIRRAPRKLPDVWNFWLSRWDSENRLWSYEKQWVNEQVPVSYGLVDERGVFIFHTAIGEVWVAVMDDGRWLILSREEIGYAAKRFSPVMGNVQLSNVETA